MTTSTWEANRTLSGVQMGSKQELAAMENSTPMAMQAKGNVSGVKGEMPEGLYGSA